jgi:hypothetical protein
MLSTTTALCAEYEVGKSHANHEVEWLDAFTYVIIPEENLEIGTTMQEGAFTWMYTGQQEYSTLDSSLPEQIRTETVTPEAVDFIGWATRMHRRDGDGRVWRVVEVDESLVDDQTLDAFYASIAEPVGEHEPEYWAPYSWTIGTCGGRDMGIWDTESRFSYSNSNSNFRKRVVFLSVGGGLCSGVYVDGPVSGRQYVLTGAHCIQPNAGGADDPIDWICSQGNHYGGLSGADCIETPTSGFTVTVDPDWDSGNSSVKNDVAVITWTKAGSKEADIRRLTGTPSTGGMDISSRSDSSIESYTAWSLGHPGATSTGVSPLTCVGTDSGANIESGYPSPPGVSRALHHEGRSDHNATTNYVRGKWDATSGASGGPVIICPSGSCGSDGEELVALYVAGWYVGLNFRTGGPKWTHLDPLVQSN